MTISVTTNSSDAKAETGMKGVVINGAEIGLKQEHERRHIADEVAAIVGEKPRGRPQSTEARPVTSPDNGAPTSDPRLVFFDDCGTFVRKRWIMKGLIARGETSAWIAPPMAGKSALLVDLAVHCAAQIDWCGHKAAEQCGVVIFALERADQTKRRLYAYAKRDDLEGLPIVVRAGLIDLMSSACVEEMVRLVRAIEEQFGLGVGLVIIDTFNKGLAAGGGDENMARDQNRMASNLRRLQEMLDVHVALVGHTGKDETRGARGSNALLGDVDLMIQIGGDEIKEAKITDANDQPERVLARFRLGPFVLDVDEDGDQVTTAIVSADLTIPVATVQTPRRQELVERQEKMLDILTAAGPSGLTMAEWNERCRDNGLGVDRAADLNEGRKALKAKRLVQESGDLWIAVLPTS